MLPCRLAPPLRSAALFAREEEIAGAGGLPAIGDKVAAKAAA
jgi:hypothetical protein